MLLVVIHENLNMKTFCWITFVAESDRDWMELSNWDWFAFKLSGDWGFGDIIHWYGEDMYGKLNLLNICKSSLKSVGHENFCLSMFWWSSLLLKVFNLYLNITCWSSCWARHLSYVGKDFKSIASCLEKDLLMYQLHFLAFF